MQKSIEHYRTDLRRKSLQGAPIILSGSLFFFLLFIFSFILDKNALALTWIIGQAFIFPLAILMAKILHSTLFSKNNPLATLAGIVGGIQALNIPVYIIIYKFVPEWLPFAVGTLTAAHFVPYIWLYGGKTYVQMIAFMAVTSVLFGSIHIISYTIVPLAISLIYGIGSLILAKTSKI